MAAGGKGQRSPVGSRAKTHLSLLKTAADPKGAHPFALGKARESCAVFRESFAPPAMPCGRERRGLRCPSPHTSAPLLPQSSRWEIYHLRVQKRLLEEKKKGERERMKMKMILIFFWRRNEADIESE